MIFNNLPPELDLIEEIETENEDIETRIENGEIITIEEQ